MARDETTDDREKQARALYDALATGDGDALSALLHPDFVGETTEGLPLDLGGTHTGAEAMARDFWWAIGAHYRARAEPQQFLALADGGLVVLGRYAGSARDGGGALDAAFAHVLRFDGERITALTQYTDSARWAAALPEPPAGQRPLRVVEYGVADGIASIRLNRPAAGNAIDPTMVEDLYEATFRAAADPSVRAVLLSGAGGNLSVGGDLPFFARTAAEDVAARLAQMTDLYHLTLERLAALRAPVVCAVRGAAAGGGMGLCHVADLVVAAEDSRFAVGYAAIGLASDGANSWYLPRVIGMRRAQELFLLNRRLNGREALEWGLVTEVVADDEVEPRARALAERLAAGPTEAFGRMKHLLRRSWTAELTDQLVTETAEMSASGASADAREGIAAFVARRPAAFHGR